MSDVEELGEDSPLYELCPIVAARFKGEELVVTCDGPCGLFYARCCHHLEETCHNRRIVYTDGACSNNGKPDAVAGIGIAFGARESGEDEVEDACQFSIPVDDRLDPGGRRTSQRAELLAALEGLKKVCEHRKEALTEEREDGDAVPHIIITTDSEYVVKGMTEWLPNWKRNDLRKANGQRPSNLDLFCKLDVEVEERERALGCKVKFWHVDRAYNTIADRLAKRGASAAAHAVNIDIDGVINATAGLSL